MRVVKYHCCHENPTKMIHLWWLFRNMQTEWWWFSLAFVKACTCRSILRFHMFCISNLSVCVNRNINDIDRRLTQATGLSSILWPWHIDTYCNRLMSLCVSGDCSLMAAHRGWSSCHVSEHDNASNNSLFYLSLCRCFWRLWLRSDICLKGPAVW